MDGYVIIYLNVYDENCCEPFSALDALALYFSMFANNKTSLQIIIDFRTIRLSIFKELIRLP